MCKLTTKRCLASNSDSAGLWAFGSGFNIPSKLDASSIDLLNV